MNYSELRQWRVQRIKGQTTDIHHFAFALDPRTTTGDSLGLDSMERAHRFLEENTSNKEYPLLFGEFADSVLAKGPFLAQPRGSIETSRRLLIRLLTITPSARGDTLDL